MSADTPTAAPQLAPDRSLVADAARNFAHMIGRDSRRFVLIVLASAAIAWIIAATQPKQYQASALAAVAPRAEELQANELLRGMEVLERRTIVETIAALAATSTTRGQVAAGSGYTIHAAVVPNTNLFRVSVQGRDAKRAAAIANRVPQVLSAQAQAVYKYYRVSVVSPAATPTEAFRPRPLLAIAGGLVIGVFLGILAAYVTQRRHARAGSAA